MVKLDSPKQLLFSGRLILVRCTYIKNELCQQLRKIKNSSGKKLIFQQIFCDHLSISHLQEDSLNEWV